MRALLLQNARANAEQAPANEASAPRVILLTGSAMSQSGVRHLHGRFRPVMLPQQLLQHIVQLCVIQLFRTHAMPAIGFRTQFHLHPSFFRHLKEVANNCKHAEAR